MKINKKNTTRASERGNVLFLILIAVVLFGALSYAVTSSSRSGGSDASSEKSLIGSSQVTQYPAAVRNAVVRMIVDGTDASQLMFNEPTTFSDIEGLERYAVFHPNGGGASVSQSSNDVMVNELPGDWIFNAQYQIQYVGTTEDGETSGNEIIAFLPGITKGICTSLNDQIGIDGIPVITDFDPSTLTPMVEGDDGERGFVDFTGIIGDSADETNPLNAQPYGCFANSEDVSTTYTYYHAIVER